VGYWPREAAASIIKSNLEADPFQSNLWYYLTKIEWEIMNSQMLDLEQVINRATQICAYAFRARVLDEKFSKENHEDYKFINLILPQIAGQKYISTNDMEGYYRWGKNFFIQQMEWLNNQEVKITKSGGPVRCLCIRCGEIKMNITKRCPRCGFLPTDMRDLYHTYTFRVESVRFANSKQEPQYWVKLNYLRNIGRNIDKALSELVSETDYETQFNRFKQDEGRLLYQFVNFRGSNYELANIKDELARKNIIHSSN
jgi:ribosomal protein L37E